MIHYIHDDITKSQCDIICHQVNCQGAMNSGVAKAIREKWPEVYESYKAICNRHEGAEEEMLGLMWAVDIGNGRFVVNLFTQLFYGYDGKRYTDYEAFYNALETLHQQTENADDKTIAFPYKIGCDRGGAKWPVIKAMIEEIFYDREVYVYYLSVVDLTDKDRKEIFNGQKNN